MLSPFGGRISFKNSREEAVGAVKVRKKAQALAGIGRDALGGEKFRARKRREFGVLALEIIGHSVILLLQDAAGCVKQPSAISHQGRGCPQDGALLGRELDDRLRAVAPLEIWIAPQCAETATRCIDEYPIELAGQAARPRVILAQDERMHIGDARSLRARRAR